MKLKIKTVKLDTLHEDPGNVRKHGPKNLAAIRDSLTTFGQVEPLVVQQKTGLVIGGNGRLAAMRDMGWQECDVVEIDADDTKAARIGIALNRTGELAEWDSDALAKLLQSIPDDELGSVGFDAMELNDLIAKLDVGAADLDDDAPVEPPKEPASRSGDLWLLGSHRLLCGDATAPADVDRVCAGVTPFLMVTDPPYGVSYDPEWRNEAGISDSARTGKVANDDRVDWTSAYALFHGTVAYVWHADRFAGDVAAHLLASGFEVRTQIIWVKPRFAISRGHYHRQHEPCWYAVRKGQSSKWCGDRKQSTVWQIDRKNQDEETTHGTQKPLECMGRPIANHGNREDVVYEPFAGSGTTLIACERLHRSCVALEIDPRYVDVVVTRWQRATGLAATLDGDGRTFDQVAAERMSGANGG